MGVTMGLGKLQEKQTSMLARLIIFGESLGCKFRQGDALRDPRTNGKWGEKVGYSSAHSVHKLKLANDLNLLINDEWIEDSGHLMWIELHDYWESMGGAPMIKGDANHFSQIYQGYW